MPRAKSTKPTTRRRKKAPSKGLGDTIEKVTEATGIKKAVKWLAGEDCGCDARKEKLNKLFPYDRHKPKKCMSEAQYNQWTKVKDITKQDKHRYLTEVYPVIAQIHAIVFDHRYHEPCTCTPRQWEQWRKDLDQVYSTYQDDAKS